MKKPAQSHKLILEMNFGSSVYGTRVPESDTDYKGIAIPAVEDIILQRAFATINYSTGNDFSKNTKDDVDREIFSLHYFCQKLTEGQTFALDMFFTPENQYTFLDERYKHLWTFLKNNSDKLISKKMTAFAGYCQGQAAKYSLKGSNLFAYEEAMKFFALQKPNNRVSETDYQSLIDKLNAHDTKVLQKDDKALAQIVLIDGPKQFKDTPKIPHLQVGPKTKVPLNCTNKTALEVFTHQYNRYGARAQMAKTNQGVDFKALMHAVRICDEGIELCNTGKITFPRPNAAELLEIRNKEWTYEKVADRIETGLLELTEVKEKSSLPESPDYKFIDATVTNFYMQEILAK